MLLTEIVVVVVWISPINAPRYSRLVGSENLRWVMSYQHTGPGSDPELGGFAEMGVGTGLGVVVVAEGELGVVGVVLGVKSRGWSKLGELGRKVEN